MALAARNAAETLAREQVALAGRPGQDRAGAGRAGRRPGAAGAARAHRVLRHQHHPGHLHGRQHGRLRGRPAAHRRVPPLPHPGGRRARTTSPATRRCCGAASVARSTPRRAPPSSCAGACPTSSSSTAARARSAPPARSSTSSACTTCRWPGWPRSARSSSCPARRDPIVLPATSGALYLLQRLRDEAHRFAITYHRQVRARAATRSALDDLAGRRAGPQARPAARLRLEPRR